MVQLWSVDDMNYVVGDMHGGGGMNTTVGVGGTSNGGGDIMKCNRIVWIECFNTELNCIREASTNANDN